MRKLDCLYRVLLVVILSATLNDIFAQVDFNHYRARYNHSGLSTQLIQFLKQNLRQEITALDESEKFQFVKRLNGGRMKVILNMVEMGAFIMDDSLETYVNDVLHNIYDSNHLSGWQGRVLILDSPQVNAYCFGEGIYIVTVGLLARISSEDELAFTLAHEVAHDVLGHIKSRLLEEVELSLEKKSRERIRRILTGTMDVEDIQEYRTLIYGARRYSRVREMEADSFGVSLMQQAAYDQEEALSMLTVLDQSLKPKFDIGPDLVWPLHSEDYPLQEAWFDERLSIYSREYNGSYLYALDSIERHPDVELRKARIEGYRRNDAEVAYHQPQEFVEAVTLLAEFETLNSAYESKAFDRCLFYALQLLNRFPENPFLISRIGKILLTLFEAKNNNDNTFRIFVPQYTSYYSDELTLVNNMLHNLSTKELGELTFYFLNNPEHFNPEEPDHYYLLWRISDLTYRRDVADDVKRNFRDKFNGNVAGYRFR